MLNLLLLHLNRHCVELCMCIIHTLHYIIVCFQIHLLREEGSTELKSEFKTCTTNTLDFVASQVVWKLIRVKYATYKRQCGVET